MTRADKLLRKLMAVPVPKDFKWDDLTTLMRQHGFVPSCDGGSHYVFEHTSGIRMTMSKPHPSGILKVYQVKDALEALRKVEAIE